MIDRGYRALVVGFDWSLLQRGISSAIQAFEPWSEQTGRPGLVTVAVPVRLKPKVVGSPALRRGDAPAECWLVSFAANFQPPTHRIPATARRSFARRGTRLLYIRGVEKPLRHRHDHSPLRRGVLIWRSAH